MHFHRLSDLNYIIKSNIVVRKIVIRDAKIIKNLKNKLLKQFILKNVDFVEISNDKEYIQTYPFCKSGIVFITDELTKNEIEFNFDRSMPFTIVCLDSLESQKNISMISRICECFSVDQIILFNCSINPKVIYNSSCALLRIPVYQTNSPLSILKKLQIEKFQIISLSEKSTNRLNKMDFKSHVAFIFGNENKGIEEEIFQISDLQVRIPMIGQVSSLNVSNACSIVLYERTLQLID